MFGLWPSKSHQNFFFLPNLKKFLLGVPEISCPQERVGAREKQSENTQCLWSCLCGPMIRAPNKTLKNWPPSQMRRYSVSSADAGQARQGKAPGPARVLTMLLFCESYQTATIPTLWITKTKIPVHPWHSHRAHHRVVCWVHSCKHSTPMTLAICHPPLLTSSHSCPSHWHPLCSGVS